MDEERSIIAVYRASQNSSAVKPNNWLNLENIAQVELSSESIHFPIESALSLNSSSGWIASVQGEQTIRIVFHKPHPIKHVLLMFTESKIERTQEYQLNWYSAEGQVHEIVRQQWNFSPNGSTTEIENHHVNIKNASILELCIKPDIHNGNAFATLEKFRIA